MGVSEPLLSAAGVIGALVAMLVDGRRAVIVATVAVAAGMLPTLAVVGGGPYLLVPVAGAAAATVLGLASRRAALTLPWVAGLDPLVPAFSPGRRLFGPRAVRVWAAVVAIPAASWVSFTVPIGEVTAVQGLLFPVAYTWACGALRLVVGRTVEDVCVGLSLVSVAGSAAWLIRGGSDPVPGALAIIVLAPVAAVIAGWLSGRHQRRPAPGHA